MDAQLQLMEAKISAERRKELEKIKQRTLAKKDSPEYAERIIKRKEMKEKDWTEKDRYDMSKKEQDASDLLAILPLWRSDPSIPLKKRVKTYVERYDIADLVKGRVPGY